MSQPELKVSAYPKPFTKAELQELLNPFRDMYNVKLQEITEEGGEFGLDVGFVCSAIVAGTLIKPFVEGFIKKSGEVTADFLLKRFRPRSIWNKLIGNRRHSLDPSDIICLTLANVPPPGYGSDRLKHGSVFGRKSTLIARDSMNSRPKGPASYMNLR